MRAIERGEEVLKERAERAAPEEARRKGRSDELRADMSVLKDKNVVGRISFDLDKYFHTRNAREKDGPCLRFAEVELLRPDAVQSDLLLVPFGIYVHIYATHAEDTGMNKQLMVHEHWISRIFAERNLYLVPESAQSLQ